MRIVFGGGEPATVARIASTVCHAWPNKTIQVSRVASVRDVRDWTPANDAILFAVLDEILAGGLTDRDCHAIVAMAAITLPANVPALFAAGLTAGDILDWVKGQYDAFSRTWVLGQLPRAGAIVNRYFNLNGCAVNAMHNAAHAPGCEMFPEAAKCMADHLGQRLIDEIGGDRETAIALKECSAKLRAIIEDVLPGRQGGHGFQKKWSEEEPAHFVRIHTWANAETLAQDVTKALAHQVVALPPNEEVIKYVGEWPHPTVPNHLSALHLKAFVPTWAVKAVTDGVSHCDPSRIWTSAHGCSRIGSGGVVEQLVVWCVGHDGKGFADVATLERKAIEDRWERLTPFCTFAIVTRSVAGDLVARVFEQGRAPRDCEPTFYLRPDIWLRVLPVTGSVYLFVIPTCEPRGGSTFPDCWCHAARAQGVPQP